MSRSKGGILEGAGGEKGMEKFGGPAPVNETTASGLVRLGRDEEKNDSGIAHRATTKKRESERERKRKENRDVDGNNGPEKATGVLWSPSVSAPDLMPQSSESTATRPRLSQAGVVNDNTAPLHQ